MNTTTRQNGFTLLSLLVGMAIGIFLVGAVIKIYLDSSNSFKMRSAVEENAENIRFAIDDMRRILVMAGREILAVEDEFPNQRPFPAVTANGIVDGGANGSDTIAIRYRKGPSCGTYQNVLLSDRPTQVRFYIDTTKNELICEMTTYSGGTPTVTKTTMASGMYRLKVLYGVDDDADGYANRYLTASQVDNTSIVSKPSGSNTPWKKVVSIRFALLAGSTITLPTEYRRSSPGTKSLLGLTVNEPDTTHLFQVASSTLELRNLHPAIQRQ